MGLHLVIAGVASGLVIGGGYLLWQRSSTPVEAAPHARPSEAFVVDDPDLEALYADAGPDELAAEISTLRALLDERTLPYYDAEFAAGRYVVEGWLTRGEGYPLQGSNQDLCARRFLPSGEVRRVNLPREEFAEMYELRERIEWLVHRHEHMAPFR